MWQSVRRHKQSVYTRPASGQSVHSQVDSQSVHKSPIHSQSVYSQVDSKSVYSQVGSQSVYSQVDSQSVYSQVDCQSVYKSADTRSVRWTVCKNASLSADTLLVYGQGAYSQSLQSRFQESMTVFPACLGAFFFTGSRVSCVASDSVLAFLVRGRALHLSSRSTTPQSKALRARIRSSS